MARRGRVTNLTLGALQARISIMAPESLREVGYIGASGSPHTGIENRQARKEALRFSKTDKKESQVGDSRESLVPRIRYGTGGPTPEGPAMRARFENDYRKSLNLLRKLLFCKTEKSFLRGLDFCT